MAWARWRSRRRIRQDGAYGGEEDYGHDLSLLIKFGVQVGLFGGSIALLGTESHHERYLRDAATFALISDFAIRSKMDKIMVKRTMGLGHRFGHNFNKQYSSFSVGECRRLRG